MTVAECGVGSAVSIRSVPCGKGRPSRCRTEAKSVRWACVTALGMPVVPDEWVIAIGSSGLCGYAAGAAAGSPSAVCPMVPSAGAPVS